MIFSKEVKFLTDNDFFKKTYKILKGKLQQKIKNFDKATKKRKKLNLKKYKKGEYYLNKLIFDLFK